MNRKRHILIVDDTEDVRVVMQRALIRAGYSVTTAVDGETALAQARRSTFDVAVIDYDIPPPNGLDVVARLREAQPSCIRILVSGGLDVDVTLDAVNRGEISRILRKPFTARSLLTAIDQSVQMRTRVAEQYLVSSARDLEEEEVHLRECIETGMLQLAIQPIVAAPDRRVVAFEALLRSCHPVLDGPLPVLRAAERHRQVTRLGAIVAEQAADWMGRLCENMKLFVNLHPKELADPHSLRSNVRPLKPWADRIVLEVTERSKVMDEHGWEASTQLLRDLGFAIAVDDLGAGYSSLSVLAELKPQFIKVDMSIVRGIDTDRHKQRLVELLCRFGEASNARIIAEGIETEPEAQAVISAGADLLQGYLFGRPTLAAQTLCG